MNERLRILLATDFSRWAAGAEAYASCLSSTWRADLTVMTVLEFPPGLNPEYPVNRIHLGELMKIAKAHMADLEARVAARGISIHTRIAMGRPPSTLTRCTPASVASCGCSVRASQSVISEVFRSFDEKLR